MAMRLVDDEAAPGTPHVTGAKATGKILRFHYHCSGKLEDFTLEETDMHKRNCELGKLNKCGRCRYLDLMAKEHRRFTTLRFVPPPHWPSQPRHRNCLPSCRGWSSNGTR